jgi:hypothetical protein
VRCHLGADRKSARARRSAGRARADGDGQVTRSEISR